MNIDWREIKIMGSRSYTCGYCGENLSSEKGYEAFDIDNGSRFGYIYICHFCGKPSFFDFYGRQTPGAKFGGNVSYLDNDDVKKLYDEARDCFSKNGFTGSVMCCRKLLMNIAVSKGAKENLKFIEYVEYLSDNNYIPPDAKKEWVDEIRKKGNEANHEIKIMNKEDAEDLISFIEMLLKMIYEFPSKVNKKNNKNKMESSNNT